MHLPMTRVFLVCKNGSRDQKRCSPTWPRIQFSPILHYIRHQSISSLTSGDSMSQTRMVPSCDADIICLPSGKKATEGRLCLCPTSSMMLPWLEASQILKPSLDPTEARYLPNANEETASPTLPNQWGVRLPVDRLKSAESEASWVQSGEKATDEVEQVSLNVLLEPVETSQTRTVKSYDELEEAICLPSAE